MMDPGHRMTSCRRTALRAAAVLCAASPFICARADASRVVKPTSHLFKMRSDLSGKHPRLHFAGSDIPRLKIKARGEARWFVEKARDSFAQRLAAPSVPGDAEGWKNYLYGFWGLFTVDMLYAVEGNARELATAKKLGKWLLTVPDWGKDDLIEMDMLSGLALTYDMLYHQLTEEERKAYRKRIYEGVDRIYPRFFIGSYWTSDFQNNHMHNRVHALAHAAFAIYGDDPSFDVTKHADLAVSVLRSIAEWLPADGSNHEGPGYWSYGHHWLVRSMDVLRHVTGEDLASENEHMQRSHYFRLYMTAPGWEHSFNIGDGGQGGPTNLTCIALTANHDPSPHGVGILKKMMEIAPGGFYQHGMWGLLWLKEKAPSAPVEELPLWRFWPDLEMLSIRTSWSDDATGFVFKCGPPGGHHLQKLRGTEYANVAHDHPDQNHFLLFAHGKMLAQDDDYPKEKKLARSHNTMVIDGKGQPREGTGWLQPGPYEDTGSLDDVFASEATAYAAGNGSRVYVGASKYVRHVFFVEGEYVLLFDDLVGAGNADHTFEWRLHKDGAWKKHDERHFSVADGDVRLDVSFLMPEASQLRSRFLPAELTAKPCLAVEQSAARAQFLSVLVPHQGNKPDVVIERLSASNCVAVSAKSATFEDVCAVAPTPGRLSAGDLLGAGVSAIVRTRKGDPVMAHLTRGTTLSFDNIVLLGSSHACNMAWRNARGTITVEAEAPYKKQLGKCTLKIGGLKANASVGASINGLSAGRFSADGKGVVRIPVELRERVTIRIGGGVTGRMPKQVAAPRESAASEAHTVSPEANKELLAVITKAVILGVGAGRHESVHIDAGGRPTRAKILQADEQGILVSMTGMEMRMSWPSLKPRAVLGLALKYCADSKTPEEYRKLHGLQ